MAESKSIKNLSIKDAVAIIMQFVAKKIEEGDYTVSLELDGQLTYIIIDGLHKFNYFQKGLQIFANIEPLSISHEAYELINKRVNREKYAIEQYKYEALKAKFESQKELI